MARVENKLIIKQMPWHANMTELNHLGAALIAKPEVFESKMTQLFTAYKYSDNPTLSILSGESRTREISSNEWEWDLRGATERPLVAVEKIEANTTPGKGRTTYLLKLDENWFLPGDILTPGTTNKKYQSRVQEPARRQGSGWVYVMKPMNDDFDFFVPATYLEPGQQWGKLFSQYEEGSEQSGSTQYSLPITYRNRLSRFRKEYKVTGDAANEVLAVKIPDSSGKFHDSWIKYAEVEYWMQWYREMERGNWYSRSTDQVLGSTGRPIYSGPGIQEQLESSHIHYYSHLTTTLIEEYLMDIFYSRVKPGAARKIKGFTGEYGMLQFHRAVQRWQEKSGFIQVVDQLYIQKTGSAYHDNALQAGFQYVKYRMANGAELEMYHNPQYDDREINFDIDPVTGYPTESQRITFLDFSGQGASSNISLVSKKGGMKLGYVHGLHSPYGPVNNGAMAHSGDYYEMHVYKQCGVHIEDTGRCGELILKRNAA